MNKKREIITQCTYDDRGLLIRAERTDEEIVRCKDCKWCDITDYGAGEVLECILDRLYRINSISLEGETYFRKVEPYDFCAWGERREDD